MATATVALDEAIKEYLLFRGFTDTLRSFEEDKKNFKDKDYKVSHAGHASLSWSSMQAPHPCCSTVVCNLLLIVGWWGKLMALVDHSLLRFTL